MTQRVYQICTRCVMDTTDSIIRFNYDGVCDHCIAFDQAILPHWNNGSSGQASLLRLVEQIKKSGRNKDFDCIIGMSGGVDSSYLTYLATELGLRPLVFHVDGGWNSQEAVNNIERLVDKLGLDLFTEVINWEEMRDLQLSFFKSGVPHIDTPQDHAFFASMYSFAQKFNVRYILTGGNYSTECIRNPIEWMYYQSDDAQLRDIHSKFGSVPLATFPLTSIINHKIILPYLKRIKVVRPLDFIPFNKNIAIQTLVEKFGWQPYPQKHFESRFTRFYEAYWLPRKFGYDTRKVQYSSLILTNQMKREDAIELLKYPSLDEGTSSLEFNYVATKLRIDITELQYYFDSPNKTFRDYRSQSRLYNLGSRAMQFLGLAFGGKR